MCTYSNISDKNESAEIMRSRGIDRRLRVEIQSEIVPRLIELDVELTFTRSYVPVARENVEIETFEAINHSSSAKSAIDASLVTDRIRKIQF